MFGWAIGQVVDVGSDRLEGPGAGRLDADRGGSPGKVMGVVHDPSRGIGDGVDRSAESVGVGGVVDNTATVGCNGEHGPSAIVGEGLGDVGRLGELSPPGCVIDKAGSPPGTSPRMCKYVNLALFSILALFRFRFLLSNWRHPAV